jgi:hypothetical protein
MLLQPETSAIESLGISLEKSYCARVRLDEPAMVKEGESRAVKGFDWDGTQPDWTKASYGYGAIHFHEDDLDPVWLSAIPVKSFDRTCGCIDQHTMSTVSRNISEIDSPSFTMAGSSRRTLAQYDFSKDIPSDSIADV